MLLPPLLPQLPLPLGAQSLCPKKFFRSAISTSFWPNSRSSPAIRRSYAFTSPSCEKTSGPFSRKSRFQALTELGCTPYAFAICTTDLSPLNTSMTIWNFSFGEYPFVIPAISSPACIYHHTAILEETNYTDRPCPTFWGQHPFL